MSIEAQRIVESLEQQRVWAWGLCVIGYVMWCVAVTELRENRGALAP